MSRFKLIETREELNNLNDKEIICWVGFKAVHCRNAKLKNNEIHFNDNKNYFLNIENYLNGVSWVNEIYLVDIFFEGRKRKLLTNK